MVCHIPVTYRVEHCIGNNILAANLLVLTIVLLLNLMLLVANLVNPK